ncbi:hypothetical protein EGW08_012386 [Elysia chlorotica]|uniref:Uncharacterized protein n=1 Tax=Elysia chlorotica TaxID=188477 RepID=A0A433TE73_ELYCH|nr:hypothetical protein EGW08_012386 [Elysia chlorotica]
MIVFSYQMIAVKKVDTSGLPSNLHNDDGRRIVGIILICVAVATMALSASVGFFYFVVCNRKPQRPSPAAVAEARGAGRSVVGAETQQGKHRHHHSHGHQHSGGRGVNGALQHRAGGTSSPAEGRHGRLAQPERTRSRDSVRTGSQQSLRSAVAGTSGDAPGGGGGRAAAHSGRPPGSRYHHKRSHKSRGFRPNVSRYKSGLEPHAEEDVEAAKSVVDLKRTLSGGGSTSSTAVMSQASHPSQFQSHQAWSEDGEEAELEQSLSASSFTNPPTIVLSSASGTQLHAMNTNESLSELNDTSITMETQLMGESGSVSMLGDTFNSTAEFVSQDSSHSDEYQHRQIPSNIPFTQNETKAQMPSYSSKQNYDSDIKNPDSTSLSLVQPVSGSITHSSAMPQQQSGAAAAVQSVSSMSSSSAISIASSHFSAANLDTHGSVHSYVESQNDTHRREKTGAQEECNSPSSYGGTDFQSSQSHTDLATDTAFSPPSYQDRAAGRGDSQASRMARDNSAFSYDGGDPDPDETADLKKIQEFMKELVDETGDV